jgi:pimeloyl-ACP methyl ester carboxylesterase
MGAHLIMVYALRNPGAVQKLVVVDPFYAPDQVAGWIRFWGKHPEMSIKMMRAAPRNVLNPFRRWKRDVTNTLTAMKIRMMATDIDRMHPNILYTTSSLWDLRPQLSALNIETLVVWGKKDRTLSPQSFPQLVDKLPKAESLELTHSGHTPHIDEPDRFNERVIQFLSK